RWGVLPVAGFPGRRLGASEGDDTEQERDGGTGPGAHERFPRAGGGEAGNTRRKYRPRGSLSSAWMRHLPLPALSAARPSARIAPWPAALAMKKLRGGWHHPGALLIPRPVVKGDRT